MQPKKRLLVVLLLIAMCIFNVAAFIPAASASELFWPAYAFTTVAFLLQILFVWLAFSTANSMKEAFLGIPIVYAGLGYLCVQLIVGLPALYFPFVGTRLYAAMCAVLLGVYACIIVLAMIGRDAVQAIGDSVEERTHFMESLLRSIEVLETGIEDRDLKKSVGSLADTIRYGDPVSHPEAAEIEAHIFQQFNMLSQFVVARDQAKTEECRRVLEQLLAERQHMVASLK